MGTNPGISVNGSAGTDAGSHDDAYRTGSAAAPARFEALVLRRRQQN